DEPKLRMNWQLADDAPDAEELPGPVETASSVDMQGDWLQLAAHDPDRLEPDAAFVRKRRGQQRAHLHRDADSWFVLEHSLPQHRFYGNTRVGELDVRALLQIEFADQLQVFCDAIVENHMGSRDPVLVACAVEVEIAELDLDFLGVGDGRVSRDEGAVGPGRRRHKQNREQCRDAPNRSQPRRRTSSMWGAPCPAPQVHTLGASSDRQRGCESSA